MAYGCMKLEQWGLAYNLLKRALELMPGETKLMSNLAAATLSIASPSGNDKMLDEAETLLHRCVKKGGEKEQPLNHLALISVHRAEPDRAIAYAEKSLKMDPEQRDARETLGYALLMKGQWKEGFYNYDFAVGKSKMRMPEPRNGEPYWDGTDGIKLFVRGEQGIGDEISYASALPDAIKLNKVTYECDKRLEGLFRRSFPGVAIHGTRFSERTWNGEFDFHCLSGSLC